MEIEEKSSITLLKFGEIETDAVVVGLLLVNVVEEPTLRRLASSS